MYDGNEVESDDSILEECYGWSLWSLWSLCRNIIQSALSLQS